MAALGGGCAGCWGDALAHEDGCHGSQEYCVAAEESEEPCRGGEDFPLRLESAGALLFLRECWLAYRNKTPATNEGSKQLTTPDIDILRSKRHEIIGRADRVGRDVDTKGNNN